MSCGMWSAVSSCVFPWPLHWNHELMSWGGPAFPAIRKCVLRRCHDISYTIRWTQTRVMVTRSPMFQVPTNTVIMSGSGFSECLFFICWSSWQKPSLFWGGNNKHWLVYIHNTSITCICFWGNSNWAKSVSVYMSHLLPWRYQTRILCVESSLSLSPPQWQAWWAPSGIWPTEELQNINNHFLNNEDIFIGPVGPLPKQRI